MQTDDKERQLTIDFTASELAHIRQALIQMRDTDAANSGAPGDECDQSAEESAALIFKLEELGIPMSATEMTIKEAL